MMMRTMIVGLFLALATVQPLSSQAQTEPAASASEPDTAAGEAPPAGNAAKAGEQWGDGKIARGPRPSKEPAKDQAYNWRFMAYSAAAMLVMLGFVVWLVRRSKRRGRAG